MDWKRKIVVILKLHSTVRDKSKAAASKRQRQASGGGGKQRDGEQWQQPMNWTLLLRKRTGPNKGAEGNALNTHANQPH